MSKTAIRLYTQFHPEHYDLQLTIDKDSLSFTGTVTVRGTKVGRPSKRLTLHQRDLKITSARLTHIDKNGTNSVEVSRINHHKSKEEVRIHTDELLRSGQYEMSLNFTGKITETMLGVYPSTFEHEGKTKTIIATQFESHHARAAFPCIDEPEAKATFSLQLSGPVDDVFLSNTTAEDSKISRSKKTVSFAQTPVMSTYLLAFVIGPLHSVEARTKKGTVVSTWSSLARPKKELEYSVTEAADVLDFYEDYFGIPYPLEKCDQVALPDFDAGAMENWGLITYREIALLTDPDNRSVSSEQYVSLVVAHELAHQWFGNLVTMQWWDDLWLNESFASLMEHLSLDALHPDWNQWENFTSSDVLACTNRDIYKDVQSVGVTVTDPELIETLFDPGIVYAKGARLLKMLREYIGDEAFRSGLATYFKKHAYKNTVRDDLWESLSESSGKKIKELMNPWIEQSGMPTVTISQKDTDISLEQKRYLLDDDDPNSVWPIPLLANKKLSDSVLAKPKLVVQSAEKEYVIFNQFGSAHYFAHYTEPGHVAYLAKQLQAQNIPSESRINILNDSIMLARNGTVSLTDSLTLALSCGEESRDSVWTLIARSIGFAQQLTEGDAFTEENIKQAKIKLASKWHAQLGWDNNPSDDANTRQLRHTAIAFMLAGEDKKTIQEALKRYSKGLLKIDAEQRASILATAVKHGDKSIVDELISTYASVSSDIQLDITAGLTATKNPEVAKHIISKMLGEQGIVRPQDVMRWIAYFIRNRYTRQTMWDFIVSEWQWLEDKLGPSKSFDYLPTYLASAMNSQAWEKKYHELFEPKLSNKTLQRNITVGFADIAARIAWRKRDEKAIQDFFKAQSEKK